jgi:hypothetical protein
VRPHTPCQNACGGLRVELVLNTAAAALGEAVTGRVDVALSTLMRPSARGVHLTGRARARCVRRATAGLRRALAVLEVNTTCACTGAMLHALAAPPAHVGAANGTRRPLTAEAARRE